MVLWGIATIGQGLVKTTGQLIAMRVLIGFFEAGFFRKWNFLMPIQAKDKPADELAMLPAGCLYLIAMWYKRYELQWRFNLFFSGSILAGAFGGLLAYGIANMAGIAGYGGWRWIFIM